MKNKHILRLSGLRQFSSVEDVWYGPEYCPDGFLRVATHGKRGRDRTG
jgi:hypothetical protein